jgi:uncharacterized protein (DUF433 family)
MESPDALVLPRETPVAHNSITTGIEENLLMAELVTEIVSGESYQYYPLGDYVVRAVGVCGGRPTFKYTRIEITGTLERLAAGESINDIVEGYRGRVSHAAVMEAARLVTAQFIKTLPELESAR